jgi:hypothetical protein
LRGRIKAWDRAVIARDRAKMLEILMATELTSAQAAFTADATLVDPEKYGFAPAQR